MKGLYKPVSRSALSKIQGPLPRIYPLNTARFSGQALKYAETPPKTTSPKWYQFSREKKPIGKQLLGALRTGLLTLSGIGFIWGIAYYGTEALIKIQGACEPLPEPKDISQSHYIALRENSTKALVHPKNRNMAKPIPMEELWTTLKPFHQLMQACIPSLADRLQQLHQNNSVVYVPNPDDDMVDRHCKYDILEKKLYLYPAFISATDGEKVSQVAHEMAHHLQHRGRFIQKMLSPSFIQAALREKFQTTGPEEMTVIETDTYSTSDTEEEAYRYEKKVTEALGLTVSCAASQFLSLIEEKRHPERHKAFKDHGKHQ